MKMASKRKRPSRSASSSTLVGLLFMAVLVTALVLPYAMASRRADPPAASSSQPTRSAAPPAPTGAPNDDARAALSSLTSAVGALSRLAAARVRSGGEARGGPPQAEEAPAPLVEAKPAVDPPPADAFDSPTACFESYLPAIEVSPGALDFVCGETEFWTLERRAYRRIAPSRGEGARLYERLGHYSLAALATMRRGCCPDAEPLLAVVPGLWCGILRDKLRALGAYPEPEPVADFDETMSCLAERGVRLPERWDRFSAEQNRMAFRKFARQARRRGAARGD